jgi:hypothetical protein
VTRPLREADELYQKSKVITAEQTGQILESAGKFVKAIELKLL